MGLLWGMNAALTEEVTQINELDLLCSYSLLIHSCLLDTSPHSVPEECALSLRDTVENKKQLCS